MGNFGRVEAYSPRGRVYVDANTSRWTLLRLTEEEYEMVILRVSVQLLPFIIPAAWPIQPHLS